MINSFSTFLVVLMVGALVSLVTLISTSTPSSVGALGILAVFILGYIIVVVLTTFLMYTVSRVIVAAMQLGAVRKPTAALTIKRAYYYASVLGLAPVIIVGMLSVGSFGVYEFGLIALLLSIGCVYITKRAL